MWRLAGRAASRRVSRTALVVLVLVGLTFLPIACLCGPARASAPADAARAGNCHGRAADHGSAPATPGRACSHCQVAVTSGGVDQPSVKPATTTSAPISIALLLPPSVPAAASARASWRAEHPPGAALLRRKCVLLL